MAARVVRQSEGSAVTRPVDVYSCSVSRREVEAAMRRFLKGLGTRGSLPQFELECGSNAIYVLPCHEQEDQPLRKKCASQFQDHLWVNDASGFNPCGRRVKV